MWQLVDSAPVTNTSDVFNAAVNVWITRPNVCSKVHACAVISNESVDGKLKDNINKTLLNHKVCPACQRNIETSLIDVSYKMRRLVPKQPDLYKACCEVITTGNGFYLFTPMQVDYNIFSSKPTYLIIQHICNNGQQPFILVFVWNKQVDTVHHNIKSNEDLLKDCFVTKDWLKLTLLPNLLKWCNNVPSSKSALPSSHSLIDQEKYTILYSKLKKKYGLHLAQIWPEVTDPQKYVYEDVAIATYLMTVWEGEYERLGLRQKQSFIDLGCGNGLLVHILNSEGYPGKGVDIKQRKVWKIYGNGTCLEESTVTPNDQNLVSGYDWILGNHSDELTPWIPVMTARSGYRTRFWVLPCCFFDLYGKFERRQSTNGQYHDYLDYVKALSQKCGFEVSVDVMRIPSTKRVCFMGMKRTHKETDYQVQLHNLQKILETNKGNTSFTARPKEQEVRNCTKLHREIQLDVVEKLTTHLLKTINLKEKQSGGRWNHGGNMQLCEAIALLDASTRDLMKQECGGLQTLLRNHHQIFEVTRGSVSLRDWTIVEQPKRHKKRKQSDKNFHKTKLCWFHINHPDGCPRNMESCPFAHGLENKRHLS